MSRRNQSSRRRSYGRRQRELRELRQRRLGEGEGEDQGQRTEEWLDWPADDHFGGQVDHRLGGPPDGRAADGPRSEQGRAGA